MTTGVLSVPKRKSDGPKRVDEVTKVSSEVLRMARQIVAERGLTLSAYLSDLLLPLVRRDFEKQILEQAKRLNSHKNA